MKLKSLLKQVLLWRLIVSLLAIPALFLIPLKDGFTWLSAKPLWANLFTIWSNFDGRHYLNLAEFGYDKPETFNYYVFFPIYPWLIRQLNFLGSNLTSALVISHLSLALALYFLYRLVRLDFPPQVARITIWLYLLFPTSFFFGSAYAESLFLLLSVTCFYAARKKMFFLAGLIAALASATRLMGIYLWPVVLIELFISHQKRFKNLLTSPQLAWLLLPPIGLLAYLRFVYIKTGSALTFLSSNPGLSGYRVVNKLTLLYQVFFRYLKMLIFVNHSDPLFFTVTLEFTIGLLFLILIILSFRRFRPSYFIYSFLIYLTPTFAGSFAYLPRYILIIFPAFILLAAWFNRQSRKIKAIYLIVSFVLTLISISLFTRGYFVA